jgi:alpha-tubulin suppressor-like RCC1 family protein
VTTNGAARCWGDNGFGQLGDGTTDMRLTPTQVSGLGSGAQHIGTGDDFTCAVVGGGVKCWGLNSAGQLGDGTQTRRLTPVNVTGLSNISTVAAGELHACALSTSGGVKCWGYNFYGQVGDGTRNSRFTPVDMAGATSGVKAISAGRETTCLVDSADKVQCLGDGGYGQMGNGGATIANTSLRAASNLPAATEVRVGQLFVCAAAGAAAYCWGSNDMGQVGDGSQLIFGLVDTFGIFLPTAVQAINYDLVTSQGIAIVIDVSKNYGAPGTLISNTQPLHGSVSCTSVGLCTYTPTVGYAGPDNFLYTLSFGIAQGSNLAAPEAPAAFQITGQAKVLVATKFVFLPSILR